MIIDVEKEWAGKRTIFFILHTLDRRHDGIVFWIDNFDRLEFVSVVFIVGIAKVGQCLPVVGNALHQFIIIFAG